MKNHSQANGVALATVAAALFLALPLTTVAHSDADEGHPHTGTNGKCIGGNACKGQSACKTASSQCAGQNACQGEGFSITTAEDCEERGGVFEQA